MIETIGAFGPQYIDAVSAYDSSSRTLLIPERTEEVTSTFKSEVSDLSNKDKVTASLPVVTVIAEQGPTNEALSVYLLTKTLELTNSPTAAGIVGGVSYALQQGVYGLATAKGITVIPKTEQAYHEQFTGEDERSTASSYFEKFNMLMGLGMSALVLNEHSQNREQDFKKDKRLVRNWLLPLVAVDLAVFTVGSYAINGAIDNADKIGVDSNTLTDALTNPMTYVAVFGIYKFSQLYKKYEDNLKDPDELSFLEKVKERFAALKRKKNTETTEHSDTILVDE